MIFRDATSDDLYSVVSLLADDVLGAKRENLQDPLPEAYTKAFAEIEAQTGNHLIVAVDPAGLIQGCLQLTFTPGIARQGAKRATIEGVRVSATQRGTGLGAKLIEHAIERSRQADCQLVQLTTDKQRPDAHRFYERLGFEPSHIGMKLSLSGADK